MSEPISVLIADDHAIIREALETAISRASDMTLVGQAETGLEAVALNTRLKPDVILLDLRMPEMDGLQALRAIKKDRPEARVVVLTSFDTEDDIIAALKAGASGYILKGTRSQTVLAAIRGAHAGVSLLDPAVTSRLVAGVTGLKAKSAESGLVTDRELKVLGLLAKGHSNRRVGEELHISTGTVKSHLSHIFRKLDVADRTEAVVKAAQLGLIEI
ncbi:MAG: response regulator transcription factor [Chloroflexi bacterium]|nr:response regulator transcription factor [Chloroflexota bacterium]